MLEQPASDARIPSTERALRNSLIALPRSTKQLIMLVSDVVGFHICIGICGWLQLIDPILVPPGIYAVAASLVVSHLLARYLGFYHSIIRYLGMGLLVAGARVAAGSATALASFSWGFGVTTQPFQLAAVYAAFCGLYLVGSRYIAQYFLVRRSSDKGKVIIYGAGEAGARVVQAMQGAPSFFPVAFVDDDRTLQGKQINGLRVYPRYELERLIKEHGVSRVLLAMPSASRRERQKVIARLEKMPVHVQTIPDFVDLISGRAQVDEFRDVDVEDLLSRPLVAPNDGLMEATLLDQTVLVTGAGGSIGSELCRQILRVGPKALILFEISEVALYHIDKELRALAKKIGMECEIIPLLGSVQDERRVNEVMGSFQVDTVYHAAAYKHVPIVEHNIIEGACNNVLGTLTTAAAAVANEDKTFVLVSTDKAVSPTNVMGATKRIAEQILQSMQPSTPRTCFSMVRFGNVLESSGSVVPLFREQIRHGGPVTVTHPEIIRYFMTIPEAAQLVIQSGAMASGGDVFVLDMGEPVKIKDLAARMIHLTGLTVRNDDNPAGDIEIQYTGLRPAEKLYEELLIGENVTGTEHPRIMRAEEHFLPFDKLTSLLAAVEEAAQHLDRGRMREILETAVQEYEPAEDIKDLLWEEPGSLDAATARDGLGKVH